MNWGSDITNTPDNLRLMRLLHLLEIVVYGAWWLIIRANNAADYNPLWSRVLVISIPVLVLVASYRLRWVARNMEPLYYASLFVLITHNFYAKHMNYDNVAWPMATYITVAAVSACFQSSLALFFFSAYTLALGIYIAHLHHYLYDFYVPGLITIVVVMNLTLYYRNRALHRLAEAKSRFEKLFNSVFEGIALHEAGLIVAVNVPFAKLFGCVPEDLIGTDILALVAPESLDQVVNRMLSDWDKPYEIWAQRKDGSTLPIQISVKNHIYENREVRMVAVRDMRVRHQVAVERQGKLEAQAAVELRDQFISIASHELRTPLTPLKLSNEILIRMIKQKGVSELDTGKTLKMLQTSDSQIKRIIRLIDDMLDVSRMKVGHFELDLEEFDLGEMVQQVVALYATESITGGSKIILRMRGPLMVCLDRSRTEQVLTNLLKNAMVYGEGRPIVVLVRQLGGQCLLQVRDQGIGICAEKTKNIFDRFERAVSAKHYGGLGLGLYIVQQIVQAQQGEIRLKSQLGHGSRFTVSFPLKPTQALVKFDTQNRSINITPRLELN